MGLACFVFMIGAMQTAHALAVETGSPQDVAPHDGSSANASVPPAGETPAGQPTGQPTGQPSDQASQGRDRFRVTLTGRTLTLDELAEPLTDTPTAALQPVGPGWSRRWRQQDAYVTLSYAVVDAPWVTLGPAFHLGVSRGEFLARNPLESFYERWETESAFLWGPGVWLELRTARDTGPFFRGRLDYFQAETGEADETVGDDRGGGAAANRYAFFRWRRTEASLVAGWRFPAVEAWAGARWRYFRLEKTLTHAIPETAGAGMEALQVVRALNSRPGRFAYETRRPWLAVVGARWRPVESLAVEGEVSLGRDLDALLRVSASF